MRPMTSVVRGRTRLIHYWHLLHTAILPLSARNRSLSASVFAHKEGLVGMSLMHRRPAFSSSGAMPPVPLCSGF
jgi:hypothetical protein